VIEPQNNPDLPVSKPSNKQGAKDLSRLLGKLKEKPLYLLATSGLLLAVLFWLFSAPNVNTGLPVDDVKLNERPEPEGVKQAVDPRATWTAEITKDLKNLQQELQTSIGVQAEQNKKQIEELNLKIEQLESKYYSQELPEESADGSIRLKDIASVEEIRLPPPPPPRKKLKHIKNKASMRKDVKDYITSGSFARAVLLTGVVAGTGTSASSAPEPIMLRLVDHAIFSKELKTEQIKEAVLIGSCSGDISSERAKCRLETLSLKNRNGKIIEKSVEGWLIGEDGRPGVKGIVVDKSSDMARMAVLNGVLGGIAQFFQNQATAGVYPISPITGQQNALKAKDSLKAGMFAGGGNALEKLADYAIKRAEQMSPVIVVASGRVVDVVFRKGFGLLNDGNSDEQTFRVPPPTTTDYSNVKTTKLPIPAQAEDSNNELEQQGLNDSLEWSESLRNNANNRGSY
jgi:conjugal transfer pilus assembly protein TraB